MEYLIACDGSCRKNGKENSMGAWAYAIILNNKVIYSNGGKELNSTNQRMELMAMIEACNYITSNYQKLEDNFTFLTDSAYITNCFLEQWYIRWRQNGWKNSKREAVANKELWGLLIPHFEDNIFKLEKVKGHSNNPWNNYVDELAQKISLEAMNA